MLRRRAIAGIVITILLMLVGAIYIYFKTVNYPVVEDKDLVERLQRLVENKKGNNERVVVNFARITNFKWDKLLIFTPYTDPKEIAGKQGFRWTNSIQTSIFVNDGENLLLFIKGDKVIRYINLPRNHGNFPDSLGRCCFDYNNAVFEVQEINDWLEFSLYNTKTANDTDKSIQNTQFLYGNSTGNVANYGMVASDDNQVYYADAEGNLRKMDADGKNKAKICNDNVSGINIADIIAGFTF